MHQQEKNCRALTLCQESHCTILITQLEPGKYHQTTIEVMEGIESEELKPGQYHQKLVQTADNFEVCIHLVIQSYLRSMCRS